MPEPPLFIKPTLTECKEHISSPNNGKIWKGVGRPPPLRLSLIFYLLYMINCNCWKCCQKCALCFWATLCLCCMSSDRENINMFIYIGVKQTRRSWNSLCFSLSVFLLYSADIKPWCRWCWDWGQSGQLSPQQLLCLCCTWDFQKWPVHCCSHGQNILCTALYLFSWGKKEGCTLVERQYPNYLPSFQSNKHASIILVWAAAVGKWGWMVIIVEKSSQRSPMLVYW